MKKKQLINQYSIKLEKNDNKIYKLQIQINNEKEVKCANYDEFSEYYQRQSTDNN
jgi:hypothetical protein